MKLLVIGAGLCGLAIAQRLSGAFDTIVVDKARGVGGRLATRRSESAKFDHGAQFYRLKDPIRTLHQRWVSEDRVRLWFDENGLEHYCAKDGMTALAKSLANGLDVRLNERAVKIEKSEAGWLVHFDSGAILAADHVVLTAPLPQALELLRSSAVAFDSSSLDATYSNALVALFENSTPFLMGGSRGYLEPDQGPIFSLADQQKKGLSLSPALTVTMKPDFSEAHYNETDEQIASKIESVLRQADSAFSFTSVQIKKWRYCQVLGSSKILFKEVASSLFLAGDAFGGPSLNGAARSATSLSEYLEKNARTR